MDDFPPELLSLFAELNARGVRYMVVGMSAAIMQGVPGTTQDIDLWFERWSDDGVVEAVRSAGGVLSWRSTPPVIAGPGMLEAVDVVMSCSGLKSFAEEYVRVVSMVHGPSGVVVPVMPLSRVLTSKRAANRPKDRANVIVIEDTMVAMREGRK